MVKDLSLEVFLKQNRIDEDTWKKSRLDWPTLQAIADDHEAASANLENSAELFAKVIQKFNGVHSVRWRVKDSEHLVEKIVRKKAEGNPKYTDITQENYFERVTDLVGVRALHLFKENCFEIDADLRALWTPIETPVAYIREGDSEILKKKFEAEGFEVKDHPAGYRSVHYLIQSMPLKRKIITEIQVRTIFEEGWSEIDHKVKYPNFSNNELVRYFLEIFNRMAGSADDMGGFVLGLVATLSHLEKEIIVTKKEKEATFKHMEQALNQLENVKKQDKVSTENIAKLKAEVSKLKEIHHALFSKSAPQELWEIGNLSSGGAVRGLRGLGVLSSDSIARAISVTGALPSDSAARVIAVTGALPSDSTARAISITGALPSDSTARAISVVGTLLSDSTARVISGLGAFPSDSAARAISGLTTAEQAGIGLTETKLRDFSKTDPVKKTDIDTSGEKK